MWRASLPEFGGPDGFPRWFRSAYRKWFWVPAPLEASDPETRSTVWSLLLLWLLWLLITMEVGRALAALCALFRCISRSLGLGVIAARVVVPGLERVSRGAGRLGRSDHRVGRAVSGDARE